MGSNDINPLPALVEKLSTSSGQDRMDFLDTVYRIAIGDQEYKRSMNTKQDGLLPILVSIISSDRGRARERALEIMSKTFICSPNPAYMLSLELDLVPVLASVLSSDSSSSDKCQFCAIAVLYYTRITNERYSFYDRTHYSVYNIGSKDLGILPSLVKVVEGGRDDSFGYRFEPSYLL